MLSLKCFVRNCIFNIIGILLLNCFAGYNSSLKTIELNKPNDSIVEVVMLSDQLVQAKLCLLNNINISYTQTLFITRPVYESFSVAAGYYWWRNFLRFGINSGCEGQYISGIHSYWTYSYFEYPINRIVGLIGQGGISIKEKSISFLWGAASTVNLSDHVSLVIEYTPSFMYSNEHHEFNTGVVFAHGALKSSFYVNYINAGHNIKANTCFKVGVSYAVF